MGSTQKRVVDDRFESKEEKEQKEGFTDETVMIAYGGTYQPRECVNCGNYEDSNFWRHPQNHNKNCSECGFPLRLKTFDEADNPFNSNCESDDEDTLEYFSDLIEQ